jgi:hypothetical protein
LLIVAQCSFAATRRHERNKRLLQEIAPGNCAEVTAPVIASGDCTMRLPGAPRSRADSLILAFG